MSQAARSTTLKEKFPAQIKYIVGNEACERFSYYGMRSILVMFMVEQLLMNENKSMSVFHTFMSGVYLFPLLGAFLADRFLGKYRTILWLSLVYCFGHFCLAVYDGESGLYWGLGLIALGAGGIKPCVSAFVGDQFNAKQQHLISRIYDIFYFSINFGSTFSTILIPKLLKQFGPAVAFGIPGILMAIATVIFFLGREQYVNVPPSANLGFFPVFWEALKNISKRKEGQGFFSTARSKFSQEDVDSAAAVWDIAKVFVTVSVFWALYDQSASSWILQARKMDQNVPFFGTILPAQMHAANPILVLLMIPLFSYKVYPWLEKRGIKITPLRKMSAGMAITGISFLIVAALSLFIEAGARVSILWQVLPYIFLTAAEVMVSITGLEFAYTQAPRKMKSTIMSFWLLTVFLGNMLDVVVSSVNRFEPGSSTSFFFFAFLMFAVSGVFIWNAKRYKMRSFIVTE